MANQPLSLYSLRLPAAPTTAAGPSPAAAAHRLQEVLSFTVPQALAAAAAEPLRRQLDAICGRRGRRGSGSGRGGRGGPGEGWGEVEVSSSAVTLAAVSL